MFRLIFVFFITSSFYLCSVGCIQAQRSKAKFVWPLLRFENASRQLSDELESAAPFRTDQWFSVADSENREQLYFRTFVMFAFTPQNWFTNQADANRFLADYDIKKRMKKAKQDLDKVEHFKRKSKRWSKRRKRFVLEDRYKLRMTKTLKNLIWIYDELEAAQTDRPKCFIHPDFKSPWQLSHTGLREIENIAEAIYAVEPIDGCSYLRVCKIHLTLTRDFSPSDNALNLELETFALSHLLPAGLSSANDEQELDDCIAFLKKHVEFADQKDSAVERAKHDFVRVTLALLNLRDKHYERNKFVPWDESKAIMDLLSKACVFAHSHGKTLAENLSHQLEPEYAQLAQFSDAEKEGIGSTIEELKKLSEQNQAYVAENRFPLIINKMTRAEFANEIKIRQVRYREIEAACQKTPAERQKDLETLEVLWTIDPVWKTSPILRYIRPDPIVDKELRSRTRRRAALCLAVAAKWRLAHAGKPPASLKEAFEYADAGTVPIDPFCGKPLKMSNSKVATVITSVDSATGKDTDYAVEFENIGAN